ncbi:MAG: hypothetical protein JWL84_5463 [Rhodospirillales bacterium]|jgi:hypothetical protein|nr:hypothetical protein [Rhodospirillales bacterium]
MGRKSPAIIRSPIRAKLGTVAIEVLVVSIVTTGGKHLAPEGEPCGHSDPDKADALVYKR